MTRNLAGLIDNAARLLQQASDMQRASDLVVLELPEGGYYLIPGSDTNLASLQAAHGARTGWQVRNSADSIVVTGRGPNGTCSLEHRRKTGRLPVLQDSPAYLLV